MTSQWQLGLQTRVDSLRGMLGDAQVGWVAATGIPGFFTPRILSPLLFPGAGTGDVSFYDTTPLRATLERLVDFDRINSGDVRLSVGAVNVKTGNFAYFDNTHQKIGPEHIMASGALPPGFPPVEIDGDWYWDGGLVSNTPLEYVLDEETAKDLLIYQVDLFSARGPLPRSVQEAAEREKDIRFSSRTRLNTDAQLRIHRLKASLAALLKSLPPERALDPDIRLLDDFSKENSITVVQLIYRDRAYEGAFKDAEFSRQTMLDHWKSGVTDGARYCAHPEHQAYPPAPGGALAIDPGLEAQSQSQANNSAKDAQP